MQVQSVGSRPCSRSMCRFVALVHPVYPQTGLAYEIIVSSFCDFNFALSLI